MELRENGSFAPIGDYAVLGDLHTCALVDRAGSIDWFPFPTIDSPPAFAALVDADGGGRVVLAPTVPFEVERHYVDGTAVLETTFVTSSGRARVVDSLNLGSMGEVPWTELARRVVCEEGEVPMAWSVEPGHRFASTQPWVHWRDHVPMILIGDSLVAVVAEEVGEPSCTRAKIRGEFVAHEGGEHLLGLVATGAKPVRVPPSQEIAKRIETTVDNWRRWSDAIDYDGPYANELRLSAIALKLLVREESGAMAAAATTSLPEKIGGDRNFDYRFAWIRDASFSLDALGRLGLIEDVHRSLCWLLFAVAKTAPALHVFYTLTGDPAPATMEDASQASGWRNSRPVHIGNSAADQRQLGCYGDLLDATWRYSEHGGYFDNSTATMIADLADRCCDVWELADAGFWELGTYQHYTSSKMACWVALDRAVRLADAGQIPDAHVARWKTEGEAIRAWIDQHCWCESKRAFRFHPETDDLDCAVLLAARTGFLPRGDARLSTTIDAIRSELGAGGSLVYRYSGQQDKEGAFLACSCWVIEALVHVGRLEEAKALLDDFVQRSSEVGLYSEEIDPTTGELLGNLPQALTHLAVIGAITAVATGG